MWSRLTRLWTTARSGDDAEDEEDLQRERHTDGDSTASDRTHDAHPFIIALTGLGGIGKSQLAVRYTHATAPIVQSPSSSCSPLPAYALRAWFDGSSVEQLQAAYLAFATTCLQLPGIHSASRPEDVREAVRAWLDVQPSWLLVFDNVECYDDVAPYLPSAPSSSASPSSPSSPHASLSSSSSFPGHQHVLITSRCRTWPPSPLVRTVEVDDSMTPAQSVELLVRLMSTRQPAAQLADCLQDVAYLSLARLLQHYPLAIGIAAAYLRQRPLVSVSEYVVRSESKLLCRQLLPTGDVRERVNRDTVAFTFLTSIDAVEHDAQQQGMQPIGRELLTACAYLHADGIPVVLLKAWLAIEYAEAVTTTPDLLQVTLPLLQAYSLLQLDVEKQTVRVHRVLQSAVRQLHGVEQPIEDSTVVDGQLRFDHPEVQRCVDGGRCTFEVTRKGYATQEWYGCAQCTPRPSPPIVSLSTTPAATSVQRPTLGCCATCARSCHAGHTLTGPYYSIFFCDCGANELAQPCTLRRAVQQTARGAATGFTAAPLGMQWAAGGATQHSDGAEQTLPPAAAVEQLSLSWYLRLMQAAVVAAFQEMPSSPQLLPHLDQLQRGYYQHLAPGLRAAGKPCPDEVVYTLLMLGEGRMLFPLHLTSPSPGHPSAQSAAESATSARAALLQCLAEFERLSHLHAQPGSSQLFECLSHVSSDDGRYEEALAFVQRALQLREALPANSVPVADHARCLYLHQQLLRDLGRHIERLAVCEQLLALSKQHFDDDEHAPLNIGVPQSMYNLAMAYTRVDRQEESNELQRSALRLWEGYCRRHADVSVSGVLRGKMTAIRAQLGACDDLVPLRQLLEHQQQRHGEQSSQCAIVWSHIASYHRRAGNYQLAVHAAMEVVRINTALHTPQQRELIMAYQRLGVVHQQWKQHQLALVAYEQAVDICRRQATVDLVQLADSHAGIVSCYLEQQQWEQAKRLCTELLAAVEVALTNTRQLAQLRWNLYQALRQLRQEPARQLELLGSALSIYTRLGDERDCGVVKPALLQLLKERRQQRGGS